MAPKTKSVFFGSGHCHLDFTTVSRAFEIQCFEGNLYHWKFSFHTNCWWPLFVGEKSTIDDCDDCDFFPRSRRPSQSSTSIAATLASQTPWPTLIFGVKKNYCTHFGGIQLWCTKKWSFWGISNGFPENKRAWFSAWCLGPGNMMPPVFYPSQIVSTEHLETSENPCDLLITSSEESLKAGPRFWFPGHLWCGLNLLH